MYRIAGAVVRGANILELALGRAQFRQMAFERGRPRLDVPDDLVTLGVGLAPSQQPQHLLLLVVRRLHVAIPRRNFGLLLEPLDLAIEFTQDVFDPRQVVARIAKPVLRLAPALLVLRDASRLLEEDPQLLGPCLDDARDHALADDGVGPRAEAGAEEHVVNVAPAHVLVVDVVARRAVARQHALDGDLAVLSPGAADAAVVVVEDQLDARAAGGLAIDRAVEDDVLHRLAAQLGGLAFAEHPAHGVDDVGLAAAVGADDTDEVTGHIDRGRIDKGLEPGELDLPKMHV